MPIVVPLDVQAQTSTLADGAPAKVGSTALAASPYGSLLALAGTDRIIRLFDAKTLTLNLSWKPHDEPTSALAFNADATLLATGPRLLGNGTLARVWDTRSGAMLYSFSRSETANIFSMVFTGDNASLLVASLDRRLYRSDLKPDALPVVMHEFSSYFTAAREGPMGLALTDSDGVHVLERGKQTPRRVLASLRTPGLSAAWTNADTIGVACQDGTRTFQAHGRLVPGVCFAPDGNTFATGSTDGAIKLWDSHTCTELLAIHPEGEVVEVAFDPTGRYLAGTCSKGLVCLYDLLAMDPYIDGNQDYQRARFNAVQND